MAKNKLEKFGFTKAVFFFHPDASADYDHPRLKLVHKDDTYHSGVWFTFQRHRMDRPHSVTPTPIYGSSVRELRSISEQFPFQDVGAGPYSKSYAARLSEGPRASATELERLAKILGALSKYSLDSIEEFYTALVAAGCPIEFDYGRDRHNLYEIDAERRGHQRRWAYGPDACRAVAKEEELRAQLEEQRAAENS